MKVPKLAFTIAVSHSNHHKTRLYGDGSATYVMVLVSAVSHLKKSNNVIFVISSDSEKSHEAE